MHYRKKLSGEAIEDKFQIYLYCKALVSLWILQSLLWWLACTAKNYPRDLNKINQFVKEHKKYKRELTQNGFIH